MNKDVIYIDVEDDVTAIIGKIKASKEKIIALVPPKRAGILQSAVNLRLLDRMASTSHKHLVLITNNQALVALSAAAGIPVAKNLQSKPELAEVSALSIDDDDDIIDGASLPVGELAKTADTETDSDSSVEAALGSLNIDDQTVATSSKASLGAAAVKQSVRPKTGIKVPNFSSFRKKLFLGITGGVLLIAFLVWANIFAPAATIVISAKTVSTPVSTIATLSGATPTDVSKGKVQTVSQQLKKDLSVKFTATGTGQVGTKATGQVQFQNCKSDQAISIPAGTELSNSGKTYVTAATVVVPGGTGFACSAAGVSAAVGITATDVGAGFNKATTGDTFSVSGYSSTGTFYFKAVSTTTMTGGDSREVTVVSDLDIQKATDALNALSTDDVKKQLTSQFTNGEVIIPDSFTIERAAVVSSPALKEEATAQATLTSATTFTLTAIPKADVGLFLKESLNKQLSGTTNQRIYNTGIDDVKIIGYNKGADATTVNITTTGQVGPDIDAAAIEEQAKGKKAGEVRAQLLAITGVEDVVVNFSFPWVTTIPSDLNKIDVQFKLTDD